MAERKWNDELKAWLYDVGKVRKVNSEDAIDVSNDEHLRRLGKEKPNTSSKHKGEVIDDSPVDNSSLNSVSSGSPVVVQQGETIQYNTDGTITIHSQSSIPPELSKAMSDELVNEQSSEQVIQQYITNSIKQKSEARKPESQKSENSDKHQNQGVTENDIFDRWTMEVYEHFAYMINKENLDIHVRFPHSHYVPHLHPEINCNDLERIAEFVEDFKFMRADKFRTSVIDPLLIETYKPVAA